MRKYLAELHKKPDHHKKQFALLASGTITLFIFGVWSLATFGIGEETIVTNNTYAVSEGTKSEISPLQSFRSNLASSLEALKSNFEELKGGLKAVDFETEYQEMRDGALKTYGQ